MITNTRYPGLRVVVDYRLERGLVRGIDPYLEEVAPGILSDDGYFKDAEDVAAFQAVWEQHKPNPDSIVSSVSLDGTDAKYEYFAVWATKGKNGKGFDSPRIGWVSVFSRDRRTGEWIGDEFLSLSE